MTKAVSSPRLFLERSRISKILFLRINLANEGPIFEVKRLDEKNNSVNVIFVSKIRKRFIAPSESILFWEIFKDIKLIVP